MRPFVAILALVLLAACGPGGTDARPPPSPTPSPTPSPSPTPDVLAAMALFEGTYTGSWTNQTFGSTGPITVVVKLDRAAGTVSITLTLGGNVFGMPAPAPETVTFKPTPPPLKYSGRSAIFGDVTASLTLGTAGADFALHGENVPSDRVGKFDARGTITDPRQIALTYVVTFKDGSAANGVASITRT